MTIETASHRRSWGSITRSQWVVVGLPKTAWILMAWLSLIYPATVMLRQHYLMDVYAGIFVGFTCYWACMFVVERPRLVPRDEPDMVGAAARDRVEAA